MAFDGMDDAMERREYLRRLRSRAAERMRADELAVAVPGSVKPVSRRESLRWLGMAAAGVAAGVRPLRALAEGATGVLAERAAGVGSSRYPAPQYGAPSLPGPSVPYEEGDNPPKLWGGAVQTATTRSELGDAGRWAKDYTMVFHSGPEPQTSFTNTGGNQSRVIFYKGPWDKPHAFDVITRPASQMTYVAPGGQSFYVEEDGALLGFQIQNKKLYLRKSFFAMKSSDDPLADAIHGFVDKVSDKDLRNADKNTTTIDLSEFMKNDDTYPQIGNVSIADGQVTVWCYYPQGRFTVDFRAKQLVSISGR